MLEETDHVNILGGGKLHPRYGNDTEPMCRLEEGGAILAAVMIGQCDYIQLTQLCHTGDIVRSAVLVTAGRETGSFTRACTRSKRAGE